MGCKINFYFLCNKMLHRWSFIYKLYLSSTKNLFWAETIISAPVQLCMLSDSIETEVVVCRSCATGLFILLTCQVLCLQTVIIHLSSWPVLFFCEGLCVFYVGLIPVKVHISYLKTLVDSFGIPVVNQGPHVTVAGMQIFGLYFHRYVHLFPCSFLLFKFLLLHVHQVELAWLLWSCHWKHGGWARRSCSWRMAIYCSNLCRLVTDTQVEHSGPLTALPLVEECLYWL